MKFLNHQNLKLHKNVIEYNINGFLKPRKANMEAYCVKCKKKVEMQDGEETTTKRGTKMMKGKCPDCSTTVCRIVGGGGKKKADDKKKDDKPADDQNDDVVVEEVEETVEVDEPEDE